MKNSLDKASIGGLLVGFAAIIGGLLLEGGKISQILQPTAAMIVFGGTSGAVLLHFPLPVVTSALRSLARVFLESEEDLEAGIKLLVHLANRARREGIVRLDSELEQIGDPFLRRALMLAVDGTEPQELRDIMELEIDNQSERGEQFCGVFDSAGGFSPTVGIIGAVLGLIQVMQHLDKIDEVGRGIAVAFVATIYGVAAANLLFLPAGGKLRIRLREQQIHSEMMLEGVISILEGMNPRMLETKLRSFLSEGKSTIAPLAKAAGAGA
jgi:chemotaxis protein MotA